MKKSLLAGVALLAALGMAQSAAARDWSGGFGGVHLGYAWGDFDFYDFDGYNDCSECVSPESFGDYFERWPVDADGWMGGATVGINSQHGHWVFGIVIDVGHMALDGHAIQPASHEFFGDDTFGGVDGGFYIAATGRIGYAFGESMVYAKAGVGGVDLGSHVIDDCDSGPCGGDLGVGWNNGLTDATVYGGGFEHALNDRWSLYIEYLHFDLDDQFIVFHEEGNGTWDFGVRGDVDTVKVGINLALGQP
jgi:opacity protein-like surface antigen